MFEVLKYLFSSDRKSNLGSLIKNDAFLVDVRSPEEFASAHAKGSFNIPIEKLKNQLHRFENKKNIIVFCNGISHVTNGGSWENIEKLLKP
jgi:rhodanese-related sulfurtransferase